MSKAQAAGAAENAGRLFGLIGSPLSHSFSEKYFAKKFHDEGIANCTYRLFPLTSIAALPALLQSHPTLEGLNVTIPYKKAVVGFLTDAQHLPAGLDACNCIRIAGASLEGYNTDTVGFEKTLTPFLKSFHTKA